MWQSRVAAPASLPELSTVDSEGELRTARRYLEIVDTAAAQIDVGVQDARERRDVVLLVCLAQRRASISTAHSELLQLANSQHATLELNRMRELTSRALEQQSEARECLSEELFEAGPTRALADCR